MEAIYLSGVIIGSIALLISCVCLSIVVGLKNSTHRIEWQPIEPPSPDTGAPPLFEHDLDSPDEVRNNSLKEFMKLHDNFEQEQV